MLEHVFYHKIEGEKDEKNSDFYIRQHCALSVWIFVTSLAQNGKTIIRKSKEFMYVYLRF